MRLKTLHIVIILCAWLLCSCDGNQAFKDSTEDYIEGAWLLDSVYPSSKREKLKESVYFEEYDDDEVISHYYDPKRNKMYSVFLDSFKVSGDEFELLGSKNRYPSIESFGRYKVEKVSSNLMKQSTMWDSTKTAHLGFPTIHNYSRISNFENFKDSLLANGEREELPCNTVKTEPLYGYWKLVYQEENMTAEQRKHSYIFIDSLDKVTTIFLGSRPSVTQNVAYFENGKAKYNEYYFDIKCLSKDELFLEYEEEQYYFLQQYLRIDPKEHIPDSLRLEYN